MRPLLFKRLNVIQIRKHGTFGKSNIVVIYTMTNVFEDLCGMVGNLIRRSGLEPRPLVLQSSVLLLSNFSCCYDLKFYLQFVKEHCEIMMCALIIWLAVNSHANIPNSLFLANISLLKILLENTFTIHPKECNL